MSWYGNLQARASLGSQAARPDSLAGLHAAREGHLSQFYTPTAIARFLWELVEPAIDEAIGRVDYEARVSLFDNSIGSGRLFQFAEPDRHILAGADVHEASISALIDLYEQWGKPQEAVEWRRELEALTDPDVSDQ